MARKNKSNDTYAVWCDHQGRTCISVEETETRIIYIPLEIDNGFDIQESSQETFHARFKQMPDYPIERACQLYLNYCLAVGASSEALDYLGQVISISKEDREMATSKRQTAGETKKPAPKTKAPAKAKAKASPKKLPAAKKAPTKKSAKKPASGEYSSAASMFRGLIMEGKLTDDQIFAEVQSAFGLDDSKRSYVKWYRNKLEKDGENPPAGK